VIGSLTIDEIRVNLETTRRVGGVVTYSGLTFRRLGIETTVVTRVSGSNQELLQALRREGISVLGRKSAQTTRFINAVSEDGRNQIILSHADPIEFADASYSLRPDVHVHLGPLHPDDIDPKLVGHVRSQVRSVSLDVQGYVRRISEGRVVEGVHDTLALALKGMSVVKADARELELILSFFNLDEVALLERFEIEELIVTDGSRGGRVSSRRNPPYVYPAPLVREGGDAVGAGDVFCATYVTHRLFRRRTVPEACTAAARLAALHVAASFIPAEALAVSAQS